MASYEGNVDLYNSVICRLCGLESRENVYLYDTENEYDFKSLINRYLPVKVEDDGKFPRTVCPGCNIQLEATIQFFDLLVEGQKKIRDLWRLELERKKKIARDRQYLMNTFKGNTSSLVTDNMETVPNDDLEDHIVIKILPDGTLFGEEHEMTLKVEGLEKPKRKRGRPKKIKTDMKQEPEVIINTTVPDEETSREKCEEVEDDKGRRKRRRKVPQRFMEAVQGVELERILREEGAIDDNDSNDTVIEEEVQRMSVQQESGIVGRGEMAGEIIGHLKTPDGNAAVPIIATGQGRGVHRRKKVLKFTCDFCGQIFRDRNRWLKHRVIHNGMKFLCLQDGCNKKFTNKNKIKMHQKMSGHVGEEITEIQYDIYKSKRSRQRVLCPHCSKSFLSANILKRHMSNEHNQDVVSSLTEQDTNCEKQTQMLETDVEEMKQGEEFEDNKQDGGNKTHCCDECNRSFNHPSSLIYHKESVHNDGRRFICSKCSKSFTHKQLLQRHQMVHSNNRPFPCPHCGLCFKTKSNLFNHRVVHTGERKFVCGICNHQFAHKTSLTLHLRWHNGHRPYKCNICNKSFTQNGNLGEHLRIHSGTKPYECEYCSKRFTTSSQHKLHVKRHTGDRPWLCSYCSKSFLHKDTWKTHERRHRGEKPFECNYCMRGFAEHWSLKKHLRLHTGEKPYSCNVCGKTFADCSNLTKHKRIHAPANSKINSTVWNFIRTHLTDGNIIQQQQDDTTNDVQQIIYVTYQDEDSKTIHLVEGGREIAGETQLLENRGIELVGVDDNMINDSKLEAGGVSGVERADDGGSGSHVALTDDEGNSIQWNFVSIDTEEQTVHVKTTDGTVITAHLPKDGEISEEEFLNYINEAVIKQLKLQQLDQQQQLQLQQTQVKNSRYQRSIYIPRVQSVNDLANTSDNQILTSEMLSGAQIISTDENIELTTEDGKPLAFVTEFEIDSYKKINEYLTTQQC